MGSIKLKILVSIIKLTLDELDGVKEEGISLLFATPWTAAYQAPPPMGFCRQEYCSGVPLPSPLLYIQNEIIQFIFLNPEEKMN